MFVGDFAAARANTQHQQRQKYLIMFPYIFVGDFAAARANTQYQ